MSFSDHAGVDVPAPERPSLDVLRAEGHRQGYGPAELRADILAGLTVAIVALPLAMALTIASGTTPDKGLVTAVVGGLFGSAFGGARFNISGAESNAATPY